MAKRALKTVASRQGGYFTPRQAIEAGYAHGNHAYHVARGNWLSIDRGIFRLPGFPDTIESDYVRWSLWAIGTASDRLVAISHNSALHYYGLSANTPSDIHLTVAAKRWEKEEKAGCILHREELVSKDLLLCEGYNITTPERTLKDMQSDLVLSSCWLRTVQQALKTQLITELAAHRLLGTMLYSQLQFEKGTWNFPAKHSGDRASRSDVKDRAGAMEAFAPRSTLGSYHMSTEKNPQAARFNGHISNRSFTLVEMLVVIAIIAALAAMLMPALSKAIGSARSLSCQNNLKSFSLAYLQYADLYNGNAPTSWGPSDADMWFSFLPIAMPGGSFAYYLYANHTNGALNPDMGFWACPENQNHRMRVTGMGVNEKQCSYMANTWDTSRNAGASTSSSGSNEGRAFGVRLHRFQWPSQLAVFTEGVYPRFAIDAGTPEDGANTVPAVGLGFRFVRYAHNMGANIAFADGHINWQAGPLEGLRNTSPTDPKSPASWYIKGKTWFYY